jgi:hypothetical protein
LKIQLEEAKRMEEVMKNQMINKEEEVEKLEEEVFMLRVEVVKISKNIEESSTSPTKKVEEKFHRLPKRKNEEKVNSYP